MRQAFLVTQPQSAALRALNYNPALERLRGQRRKATPLRELVSSVGASYGNIFASVDCDAMYGVEILSQREMFRIEPEGKWIRRDSMTCPDAHLIKKWQVIIAGTGTLGPTELYGRCVMADERLAGKYLGTDGLALSFHHPTEDVALYTYAFLCSPLGVTAIRSMSAGTKLLRPRLDMLVELPVPLPRQEIIQRVAVLVRHCIQQREVHMRELRRARHVLESLPEMRDAHAMCAQRRARCVTWDAELSTLVGWTYASTGGALDLLRKSWRNRLGDALEPGGLYYGLLRQRTPSLPGNGVPLITQRDALSVRQIPSWIAHPGVQENALFSRPHSLIMAGRGTLGEGELFARPIYITPRLSRYALTQDLLRLVPHSDAASIVYVYLSTLVGRRLLRSTAVGTKILQLRTDLLRALPYPDLSVSDAEVIRSCHQTSVAAYDAAINAESEAIRIIEEEVLPEWLA